MHNKNTTIKKLFFIVSFSFILLQLIFTTAITTIAFAQRIEMSTYEINNNYGLNYKHYNLDYSTFENPDLDMTLQYPSDWRISHFDASPLSILRM